MRAIYLSAWGFWERHGPGRVNLASCGRLWSTPVRETAVPCSLPAAQNAQTDCRITPLTLELFTIRAKDLFFFNLKFLVHFPIPHAALFLNGLHFFFVHPGQSCPVPVSIASAVAKGLRPLIVQPVAYRPGADMGSSARSSVSSGTDAPDGGGRAENVPTSAPGPQDEFEEVRSGSF